MSPAAAALSASLATASTAELLAFYNKHAAQPIARFSDRAAAVRRCWALIDVAVAKEEAAAAEKPLVEERPARNGWNYPAIRAARTTRDRVAVEGVEYASVRAAFVALGLPLGRHIAFRARLKEVRALTFQPGGAAAGVHFVIV